MSSDYTAKKNGHGEIILLNYTSSLSGWWSDMQIQVEQNHTVTPNERFGFNITVWHISFTIQLGSFKRTLPKTTIAPENGCLEFYFPFGMAYFQLLLLLVSGRVNFPAIDIHSLPLLWRSECPKQLNWYLVHYFSCHVLTGSHPQIAGKVRWMGFGLKVRPRIGTGIPIVTYHTVTPCNPYDQVYKTNVLNTLVNFQNP